MASLLPPLRRVAPKLGRDFFVCRQGAKPTPFAPLKVMNRTGTPAFQTIRFYNSTAPLGSGSGVLPGARGTPLTSLSQTITKAQKATTKKKFFPETSSKSVGYWLLGSAASVFGIVVFGGLTRLTESGYAS